MHSPSGMDHNEVIVGPGVGFAVDVDGGDFLCMVVCVDFVFAYTLPPQPRMVVARVAAASDLNTFNRNVMNTIPRLYVLVVT
jgi:hypothetical protein